MGEDMFHRDLYHPADRPPNFARAKALATRLASAATRDQITQFLDGYWTHHDGDHTDHGDTEQMRTLIEHTLHRLLDQLAESLTHPDVCTFRFDQDDNPGVQAYVTGGLSTGDAPTDTYHTWDIITEHDRLPDQWGPAICAALGLIHPYATGKTAATVTFRTWTLNPNRWRRRTPPPPQRPVQNNTGFVRTHAGKRLLLRPLIPLRDVIANARHQPARGVMRGRTELADDGKPHTSTGSRRSDRHPSRCDMRGHTGCQR